jgi:hypothetical protein
MAQLYQAMNQPAKRVEALQAAVRESSDATQVRLELARALREQKKPQEALTQLNEASKSLAAQPDSPSMFGGGSPAAGCVCSSLWNTTPWAVKIWRTNNASWRFRRRALPARVAPVWAAPAWEECLRV